MFRRLLFLALLSIATTSLEAQSPSATSPADNPELVCNTATADNCQKALDRLVATGSIEAARARTIASNRCLAAKDAAMCVYYGYLLETGVGGAADLAAAVRQYEAACQSPTASAAGCYALAGMLSTGRGVAVDNARAYKLASDACATSYWRACVRQGQYLRDGTGTPKNVAKAQRLYEVSCDKGEASGCLNAADGYATGTTVPVNDQAASGLYNRACDLKSGRACTTFGFWVQNGRAGITPNLARANSLYELGCNLGDPDGCNNLAASYLSGMAIGVDSVKAFTLRSRACTIGLARACADLGYAYEFGIGTKKDISLAALQYGHACDASNAYACWRRGLLVRQGAGGLRADTSAAFALFQKGCNGSDRFACGEVGLAYIYGQGTARDTVAANRYFKQACEAGNATACANYGSSLHQGAGVAKNDTLANRMYRLACDGKVFFGCGMLGDQYNYARGTPANESRALSLYMQACTGGLAWACDRQHTLELQHVTPEPLVGDASGKTKAAGDVASGGPASPEIPSSASRIERYALIVGISKYRADTSLIRPLCCARTDAQAMYDFFTSPSGGSFTPSHVKLLLDQDATGSEVRSGLVDFLGRATPNDLVVIYIAAHGSNLANQGVFLLTHDINLDKPSGAGISLDELRLDIAKLHAGKVVAFIDMCHGGAVTSIAERGDAGGANGAVNRYLEELQRTRNGRVVFAASQSYESSLEGAPYGGHGAFTDALLTGLRGAASGDDRIVTLSELVNYTTTRVKLTTKERQHPSVGSSPDWDPSLPMAILPPATTGK